MSKKTVTFPAWSGDYVYVIDKSIDLDICVHCKRSGPTYEEYFVEKEKYLVDKIETDDNRDIKYLIQYVQDDLERFDISEVFLNFRAAQKEVRRLNKENQND